MAEFDLNDVLKECKKAASIGYKIAAGQHKNLKKTLSQAQEEINTALVDFQTSTCYVSGATEMLSEQLLDIESSFNKLSFTFSEDLNNLHDNLSKFSITLFGRTMSGKSTLMEILTHGDGTSIGRGAQRTTRDIRTYTWNHLEITDVPGIGAFEGEDDENIAFEAAKKADLILFLITDDAPQAAEAECFGRIISLGKPVVCIVNVKAAISENKNIKLAIRDINKRFDKIRLDEIHKQFLQYSRQLGQDWGYIPFVNVHLKSAFLAQNIEDPVTSESLYNLSRMEYLKNRIVNLVRNKGEFYRIKTFIDIISNPMLGSMENLLNHSNVNSMQGRTILSKKRQFIAWKAEFVRDGKRRISSLITSIRSQLNAEIASFAEDNYNNSKADKEWNQLINNRKIRERCQELLDGLQSQCDGKIKEISREITSELKFSSSFTSDKSLQMNSIIDGKRIWNWSATIVSGGLSVAAIITGICGAAAAGPLGWAALVVGAIGVLGSFFFPNREKKEQEARQKLENKLKENVNKVCDSIFKQLNDNFDSLITNRIDALINEMERINSVVFRLADTQKKLAWDIDEHVLELNYNIITEALRLIEAEDLRHQILKVARIPGTAVVFMLKDNTLFPYEQTVILSKLISEKIRFIYHTDSKRVLISRVIGRSVDRKDIRIEEKIGVAHISMKNISPDVKNRIRMAQQFARILITN